MEDRLVAPKYMDMLAGNKVWATRNKDCHFFHSNTERQRPKILWLGCIDSRVSPNDITHCKPGSILEYRSIANTVRKEDLNLLAILNYAIYTLEIKDIVICGHSECGGLKSALQHDNIAMKTEIREFLVPVFETIKSYKGILNLEGSEKVEKLGEIHLYKQYQVLSNLEVITKSRKNGDNINVHACMYDIKTGILTEKFSSVKNIEADRFQFL